ncbi:protein FAM81B [Boleophthalmus pectinirostris]|uniref:protein FAM81B n=1 Tax=Boleophthalmus pectinirostris TaxID=150288 RepID=UPI0024326751|nr:protein FAM81B [Boleophthalmus pectinirostris]
MSNVLELPLHHTNQRPDVLAGRGEDRALAVLLEQAFRIKEEVSSGLQRCEGSAQAQTLSRTLLQSHILTITRIVQQLSVNVQSLQRQIVERDWVTNGTTQAVQWLDSKSMAGIGDLRGRVTRCDASLVQLSAEVKSTERQVMHLQHEVNQLRSAVELRIKEVHVKLQRDLGRLEASLAEVYQIQRSFMSEQEAERGLLNRLQALEIGLEQFRSQQEQAVCNQAERLKNMETRLSNKVDALEKILHHEVQLLKHNYHKGFRSVHDAIETLKEIADLNSRLQKGKIQKELARFELS